MDCRRGFRAPPVPQSTPYPKPGPTLSTQAFKIPVKRLTSEELAVRRDQGLCYHCDDKWSPGHRCKPRLHLFIADDEPDELDSPSSPTTAPSTISQISLNAMEGTFSPQTFCLLGSIHHQQLVILVDGGSTHNFIQTRMARFLALPSSPTTSLRVMVGNGSTLDCDTVSHQVPFSIQGNSFTLDLFHLPLCGVDIVLGMQWLKLLGPITTDYAALTMTFHYMGHNITLHADAPLTPASVMAHQLKRFAQTQSISALFHIAPVIAQPESSSSSTPPPSSIPPLITTILAC